MNQHTNKSDGEDNQAGTDGELYRQIYTSVNPVVYKCVLNTIYCRTDRFVEWTAFIDISYDRRKLYFNGVDESCISICIEYRANLY